MSFIVEFDGEERALRGDIRLNGTELDLIVGNALQSFDEELAVDGSPIIRMDLLDPDCQLVRSDILDLDRDDSERLDREVELIVDRVAYWLRGVSTTPDSDTVSLTFEDRTVCLLRDGGKPTKIAADTIGDRGFIELLCKVAGAPKPITAPPGPRERDARRRAGIGTKTAYRLKQEQDARDRNREPGISAGVPLTVKGLPATAEQRAVMAEVCRAALAENPPLLALRAMVTVPIVETDYRNVQGEGDDHVSWGVIQAIAGTSAGINGTFTLEEARDIAYSVRSALHVSNTGFRGPAGGGLIGVALSYPDWTPGRIAAVCINGNVNNTQGSPDYVGKINSFLHEGDRIIEAYTGGQLPLSSGATTTTTTEAALTVENGESYWDAARRAADARNARFFVVANQPYYLYDEALMRSRPRLLISDPRHPRADAERAHGVVGIGWEWAPRRPLRRTDLVVNASVKQAPPGSVVILDGTCGPAGAEIDDINRGRWLVGDYQRSRFEQTARITLIKGRKPKVPTETTTTETPGGADGGARVGTGGTTSPFGGARTYPVSDPYGPRPNRHHNGVDVGVPFGTPCIAPFDGRIGMVSTSGFGSAGGMVHLEALAAVPGTSIRAGDKIGWGHVSAAQVSSGQTVAAGTRVATSGGSPAHVHFVLLRLGGGGNGTDGNTDPTSDLRALGGIP